MQNISTIVEKIGLNKKEAVIYTSLLRLGQSSATTVAKDTGIKRPTVYVVLENLRKNGYVLKIPGSTKQMFIAQSPEEIIKNAESNILKAKQILPQLMNMFVGNDSQVRTIHFEGLEGIKKAYEYKLKDLKNTEIVAFFGTTEDASRELVEFFHGWNKMLPSLGVTLRSIVPDSKTLVEFRKNDTKYGFKPKVMPNSEYTSKTSIEITNLFVRITMFKEQQSVIVESPIVAKALKEVFEMVWTK